MDKRQFPANDRVVARWLAHLQPDLISVEPENHFVTTPVLDLSLSPGGNRDRQLLYGDPFEMLETRGTYSFGIANSANYVGWVETSKLSPESDRGEPTDCVRTRQTHVYSEPDFKSREILALPHLALLCAGKTDGRFIETELGWVPMRHLDDPEPESIADVAEIYLGTPYLWGANSSFGIDCSGLVHAAFLATGETCPGDSDQQEAAFPDATGPFQRGDLLFWKGHVAIVTDPATIIHANAHHMAVAFEPIADAITRIQAQGDGPVTSHKRPNAGASHE